MRSIGISLISIALTGAVVSNAYYQKKQFYPSVVYITKSNPSMAVIYIQSLVLVLMLGKMMRKIFLGTLRAAEFEHLMERFWYALTETCLAFTVFRDDFNPKFVALFTVLLFLKSFHWLAEDRVDYMERSPVIGWLFHVRVASLLVVLGLLDYMMISDAYHSTITKGATVQLVFGFEYAILITMVANTTIKYVLHAAEMRSEAPWDNKAVFLLYTELVIGLIRVILYVLFVIIMIRIYTLPLFAFRPMYYTMRNFKKALNDVILSRRAIRNMNTLYPDATPEELALSDNICIICREDMVNNSKKLPCGHIFHTACLRSWFQRQQTCPTCRLNILRTSITAAQPQQAVPAAAVPQVNIPPVQNDNAGVNNLGNQNNNNNIPVGANPFANLLPTPNQPFNFGIGNLPMGPLPMASGAPLMLPSFPFMSPYAVPPPPMPPSLDTLTDDEVRALEGTERQHVEERIKFLRNIQLMLNASTALMNQYTAITARLPPVLIPSTIPVSTTPTPMPIATTINTTATNPSTSTTLTSSTTVESQENASNSIISSTVNEKIDSTNNSLKNENNSDVLFKLEDVGSEEHLDIPNLIDPVPGTSKDIANDSDTTETSEVRRRRLQKFLQNEKDKTQID